MAKTVFTINIGEYFLLGKYYNEPILWRCVDTDRNGSLMLSDRILTVKSFDAGGKHRYIDGTPQADSDQYTNRENFGSNLWETSNIRCWLNSDAKEGAVVWLDDCPPKADRLRDGLNEYAAEQGFLSESNFSHDEYLVLKCIEQKSLINAIDSVKLKRGGSAEHIYVHVISDVVQNYQEALYHNVQDRIFLLDIEQINKVYQNRSVLGTDYYLGKPTRKAVEHSQYKSEGLIPSRNWHSWLRSPYVPYFGQTNARYVSCYNCCGVNKYICNGQLGVRPAFYMNSSVIDLYYGNGTAESPYTITSPEKRTADEYTVKEDTLSRGKRESIPAAATAVRILIAHTGENLESQDLDEIMKYSWNGHPMKPDTRITSHPFSNELWTDDEKFAFAWLMWIQMLQYKYGEYPYWDECGTYAYRGQVVRTGQRFYIEVYFLTDCDG